MSARLGRMLERLRANGAFGTLRHGARAARRDLSALYIDLRYGGRRSRTHPNVNSDKPGCHYTLHTDFSSLRAIFRRIAIAPDDVLVDIGCGDGRLINFWLSLKLPNKLVGIELDSALAQASAAQYRRYSNVTILAGDAAQLAAASGGTLFFLFNPFDQTVMTRFEQALRGRAVRIVYFNCEYLAPFETAAWRIEKMPAQGHDGSDLPHYPTAVITAA